MNITKNYQYMRKNTKKHKFIASTNIHPGDLIFYFSLDAIQGKPNANSVEHVGICVGHDKYHIPLIAHATYGNNTSQVMITPLTALYGYLVFRLSEDHDPKHRIRNKIVDIATTWASQEIPYDFKRKQHMSDFLKQHDTIHSALKASKKAFTGNGDYRALKFAIRGDQPIKEGSPRGFRCDQFVILCLQVAELQLLNQDVHGQYFTPLASPNNPYPWISITNPNRGLIRQLPKQGYQQILSHERPIKDYAEQFCSNSNFSDRRTKHETIGRDTAPMMLLAAPFFIGALQDIYHDSLVPLNAKDCSPSTLIQHFMDDDGGSGFKLIGIVVKQYLAKHFPDHKIIEHDIIEKSIPKKQPVKMDSEGDIFYTHTLQTLLLPSQPQAQSIPSNGLDPTQGITPCLTLFLQHHQQLNDAQLEGIVRHMKRRQLSDAWQNLSSNSQTSLGHRLFHIFNNNTSQAEPNPKRACTRQNH
ncbi:MAG TPA: hypothetical protein DCL40_04340 [Coxiellaceae bacterium]|nr:hypothetical protein [Coxiellaceae bacterium]